MKTLYLLRHGDAVSSPHLADADRPLSDDGRKSVEAAGMLLKRLAAPIGALVSSPLRRAIQSAEIISQTLGVEKTTQSEYLVPGSRLQDLLDHVQALPADHVLLVGHEPQLSSLISYLTVGQAGLRVEVKKGSLACLAAEEPVAAGTGTLLWLVHTSHLPK